MRPPPRAPGRSAARPARKAPNGLDAEVASLRDRPFLVLPGSNAPISAGSTSPTERCRRRSPLLDLFVEPLEHVRAVQLALVLTGKPAIREDVLGRLASRPAAFRNPLRSPSTTFRRCAIAVA